MIFEIILMQILLSLCQIQAQLIAYSNNKQILMSLEAKILPYTNASSLYYPNDTITMVKTTSSYFYALSSSGVIQIFNKNNPSIIQENVTNYFLFNNQVPTFQISAITFDEKYNILVLSALYNSALKHIVFNTINESLPQQLYTVNKQTLYEEPPLVVFIANNIIYSFFSTAGQNDSIFCVYLSNNYTFIINLSTSNSSLAVSPDGHFGLAWTEYSLLYIYNISNNFSLLHTYNQSVFNQKGTTQFIKFSQDSTMAILETDNHNPIRVINLIDLSTPYAIIINKKIKSVQFLDIQNRFILINCVGATYSYDTATSVLLNFNTSLSASSTLVDQTNSQIIADLNGILTVFGVNATVNSTILFGHYFPTNSSSIVSNNFSYRLNLSEWQNKTFDTMSSVSKVIEDTLKKFNSIIFSSPLTCFFLGFLNYFALNSIYVLLNIPLPDLVFNELSSVYNSISTNLLTFLNIHLSVSPFTDEFVDEEKPLYFGVSSDLIYIDYYPAAFITLNIMFVQFIIFLNRCIPKDSIFYRLLTLERQKVYFGLVVSILVGNVIPWRFITFHEYSNFKTKTNSFFYHIIFILLVHFLSATFVSLFSKNRKNLKKDKFPQWMIGFQNFIYPLLVIVCSPWYFLILIVFSKIFEIIIYLKHQKCPKVTKILQIGSFICQLIYHFTFFIFFLCRDETLIIYNSILCISIFLFGATINFILVIVTFFCFFAKFWNNVKRPNKIVQGRSKFQSKLKSQLNKKDNVTQKIHESPAQFIKKNGQNSQDNQKTIKQKKNVRFQYWDFGKKPLKHLKFQLKLQQRTIKL